MRATIIEDEILQTPTQADIAEVEDWLNDIACEKEFGELVAADIESLKTVHNPFMSTIQKLVTCELPEDVSQIRTGIGSAVKERFIPNSDQERALTRLYRKMAAPAFSVTMDHFAMDVNTGEEEPETIVMPLVTFNRQITDASPSQGLGE